jgi:hypothetical protein
MKPDEYTCELFLVTARAAAYEVRDCVVRIAVPLIRP